MARIFRSFSHHIKSVTKKQDSVKYYSGFGIQRHYTTESSTLFSTSIPEFENKVEINSYEDLYKYSLCNPDEFWGTLARSRLRWFSDFDRVQDCSFKDGKISWFLNGKINVCGKNK